MTITDMKRGRQVTSLALAVLLAYGLPATVSAAEPEFYEVPFAPGQWNYGRRLDESQLRYCVDLVENGDAMRHGRGGGLHDP